MAQGVDERKRREWAERLERRRASGLTVARFCAREGVSANTFYYWSKRLGSAAAARRGNPAGEVAERAAAAQADERRGGAERPRAMPAGWAVVRFHLGGGVTVEVPAEALDVIRCLAESVARDGAQAARPELGGGFHELVLGARR